MKLSSLKKLAMVCIVAASSNALAAGASAEGLAAAANGGVKLKGAHAGTINITQIQVPSLSIPMVGDSTILPNGIVPSFYSPKGYSDLQAICETALGEIARGRSKSVKYYNMGNMDLAADALVEGLENAAKQFAGGGFFGQRANPATVMAVRHGAALAKYTAKDTESFRGITQENTGALKFYLVNEIVEVVESVFERVDRPFFFTSIGANGHCMGHGCYRGLSRNLPVFNPAYFGKTAEVASKFIGVYTSQQGMMAHNLLRLSIAAQASWSAAEILNTSPFRYDYACAVARLANLNKEIKESVQEYFAMPGHTPQQVANKERFLWIVSQSVNEEMGWALNQVELQSCEISKGLKAFKKHGHGHGYGQDDNDIEITSKRKSTTWVDTDGDGDMDVVTETKSKRKIEID